jgi:hypothetical protein
MAGKIDGAGRTTPRWLIGWPDGSHIEPDSTTRFIVEFHGPVGQHISVVVPDIRHGPML